MPEKIRKYHVWAHQTKSSNDAIFLSAIDKARSTSKTIICLTKFILKRSRLISYPPAISSDQINIFKIIVEYYRSRLAVLIAIVEKKSKLKLDWSVNLFICIAGNGKRSSTYV
jgi:hypothetical protein